MRKIVSYCIIISLAAGMVSCKAKKCADFSDPRNNYKANYNKKGLVKKKKRDRPSSTWSDKY